MPGLGRFVPLSSPGVDDALRPLLDLPSAKVIPIHLPTSYLIDSSPPLNSVSAKSVNSLPAKPSNESVAFDFDLSPIVVGPWLQDSRVANNISSGLFLHINDSRLGHIPPRLRLDSPDELAYIQALVEAGVLIPGRAKWNHRHFFSRQGKLRLIFDGRRLNSHVDEPEHFNMPRYSEYADYARRFSFAAKFDFRSFYFNNRLHPSLYHLFGIRTSIGDFCWTRTPFGFNHSAFHAHLLSQQLLMHLRSLGLHCIAYMDDFVVFGHSHSDVSAALASALSFCNSIGVCINPAKTVHPCQVLSMLGVTFDLANKRTFLNPSFFTQLHKWLDHVESRPLVSKRRMHHLAGSLIFANNAWPGSLSLLSPLFKHLHSLPGGWKSLHDSKHFISISRSVINAFSSLPPCTLQSTVGADVVRIFSDACPWQLGAVINGTCHAKPIEPRRIFDAEALAVGFALQL